MQMHKSEKKFCVVCEISKTFQLGALWGFAISGAHQLATPLKIRI